MAFDFTYINRNNGVDNKSMHSITGDFKGESLTLTAPFYYFLFFMPKICFLQFVVNSNIVEGRLKMLDKFYEQPVCAVNVLRNQM